MSEPQMPEHLRTRAPGERPKPGQIHIDGHDAREVSDATLMRALAHWRAQEQVWPTTWRVELLASEAKYRGLE